MGNDGLILSSYEDYTKLFDALSHPMRIKILGILSEKRRYVSELAKLVNISRPLLYMHLRKLEDAAIVVGCYEISDSGKTMKYYESKPFAINVTPGLLESLARTIPIASSGAK